MSDAAISTVVWSPVKECNKIQKVTQISKVGLTKRKKNYRKVKKWLLGEEILDNDKNIHIYIYIYQTHAND